MNVVLDRKDGLQEPNDLNCLQRPRGSRQATTGAMVNGAGVARDVKSMLEPSVWNNDSHQGECRPSPVGTLDPTGYTRYGCAAVLSRFDRRSALPGAKSITYRTKGLYSEHENPEPSAGPSETGKPPSLAMSWSGGGALVVVRARESRAHGEGEQ